MTNLKAKIDGHNKKTRKRTPPKAKLCNCLEKENCPMKRGCLTETVLYYAGISCEDAYRTKSFNAEKSKSNTKLSTKYLKLAKKKLHPRISWSIKVHYKSYNHSSRTYITCFCTKNWN